MDLLDRLDPELATVVRTLPPEGLANWQDLPGTRAGFDQLFATSPFNAIVISVNALVWLARRAGENFAG